MKQDSLFWIVLMACVALWAADTVWDLGLIPNPVEASPTQSVKFSQVRPIFEGRCQRCHSEAKWDWTDYDVAYSKRQSIKARVWILRTMPVGGEITQDERKLIRDWVDDGGRK